MKKKIGVIIFALVFTLTILTVGYISFGFWTNIIFASGFAGGFVLWLFLPTTASFASIKVPYWVTLFLFLLHRVEENIFKFQEELSKITGVPVPDVTSLPLIILILTSVGAWLFAPFLINRG